MGERFRREKEGGRSFDSPLLQLFSGKYPRFFAAFSSPPFPFSSSSPSSPMCVICHCCSVSIPPFSVLRSGNSFFLLRGLEEEGRGESDMSPVERGGRMECLLSNMRGLKLCFFLFSESPSADAASRSSSSSLFFGARIFLHLARLSFGFSGGFGERDSRQGGFGHLSGSSPIPLPLANTLEQVADGQKKSERNIFLKRV